MRNVSADDQVEYASRLTLLHKGLILIAVPLVFELLFVAVLGYLFLQSNAQLSKINEAHEVSEKTYGLLCNMMDAISCETGYYIAKSPSLIKRYQQLAADVPSQIVYIRDHLSNDPDGAKEFANVESSVRATLAWSEDTRIQIADGKNVINAGDLIQLKRLFERTKHDLVVFMAHRSEIEKTKPLLQKNYQSFIWFVLIDGVIINVLLALALVLYLHKSTASRLMRLMDNIHRFAGNEPPLEPMSGSDEIAELDRVFSTMAKSLIIAAQNQRQMEKMKQDFVAMVSHDLKSPLTAVSGSLALISSGCYGQLADKGPEVLATAEAEIDRLSRLVEDLLDLAKIEAGRMHLYYSNVVLDVLIKRAVGSVGPLAERQDVAIETMSSKIAIEADGDRILQVLVNLLSNAVKFSPQHSKVEIAVADETDYVKIKIIDNGRGVPADRLELIFDPYVQVEDSDEREKGGTGLGLPICKNIVERHGGKIGVDSKEGEGSTFWFTLPKTSPSQP